MKKILASIAISVAILATTAATATATTATATGTAVGTKYAIGETFAYNDGMPHQIYLVHNRIVFDGEIVIPHPIPSFCSDSDSELDSESEGTMAISLYYNDIVNYGFSQEEKNLMAKVVMAEAGTEPFEGKIAVAAVILNRYFGWQSSSIEELIYAPNQFAIADAISDEVVEAVEMACQGYDPVYGLCHFVADYCEWQPDHVVMTIGHHNFY